MAETQPQLAKQSSPVRTVTGWTLFFMVLLRIAIGWHFAYEGVWKLMQEDWRATGYLVQSSGPFRPLFRWMVRDPDGLERLTRESMKQRIDDRFEAWVSHFELKPPTDDQIANMEDPKAKAAAERKKAFYEQLVAFKERKKVGDPKTHPEDTNYVDAIFDNQAFQQQLGNYKDMLEGVEAREERLGGPKYNTERLGFDYGKKSEARNALLERAEAPLFKAGPLDTSSLEGFIYAHLTEAQLAKGPPPGEKSQTWFIDWANMWALTLVGVCLMLGLFTRLAAVGGIGLLALYYFAMPPWPWLPENPMAEGHYLFIDKNAIEAIALMMIATTRIGRWGGLDAWISRLTCSCDAGQQPPQTQQSGSST